MNIGAAVLFICLPHIAAHASTVGQDNPWKGVTAPLAEGHLLQAPFAAISSGPVRNDRLSLLDATPDGRQRPAPAYVRESAFAQAIARSFRKTLPEKAIEAATKIIVMCQKEQNPALTTPFFRSDSQQAHCFRY